MWAVAVVVVVTTSGLGLSQATLLMYTTYYKKDTVYKQIGRRVT